MLYINWILREDEQFRHFCEILRNIKSGRLYQTELLKILMQEFWLENYTLLCWYCFLPWLLYFVSTLYYMVTVLEDGFGLNEHTELGDYVYMWIVGRIVIVLSIYQCFVEIMQY